MSRGLHFDHVKLSPVEGKPQNINIGRLKIFYQEERKSNAGARIKIYYEKKNFELF